MTTYQHTQVGKSHLYLIIGSVFLLCAVAIKYPVVLGVLAIVALVTVVTGLLFRKLTVTVNEKVFRAAFGPGLVCKEVPISDVERCDPMRVRWWHGIGIHLTGNGWLYNVSLGDAVIVILRNGRKFCVGTDEPQELREAVLRFASAK